MIRPTRLQLIRQADRVPADGVAWRRRYDRWVRLGYSHTSPEQRALASGTVDFFQGFKFVRTVFHPAARRFKGYAFLRKPLLFARGVPVRRRPKP